MRIIDKIKEKHKKNDNFFSFEYFPPKTEIGVENLLERIDRMSALNPLWVDVTWGAGGSTAENCLMHLTCRCSTKDNIDKILEMAKINGIVNILALRGDPPQGQIYDSTKDYFQSACDLVKYIRKEYKDYFCIVVAGYPETHIESKSKEEDLKYLKMKIDAGADLILTQLFYDVKVFFNYIKDCQEIGIIVPIIPGLLPIQNFNSFKRIVNLCNTQCPNDLLEMLEKVRNDDEKVKQLGIEYCTSMCNQLLEKGVLGLHFYTLNLEKSVCEILSRLDIASLPKNKILPWKRVNSTKRTNENVRPIFWKNSSKSYHIKTYYWDEFPNGLWGDSRSPAFGKIEDQFVSLCKDYFNNSKKIKQLKKIWGEKITCLGDINRVFVAYIEGRINSLPWCEENDIQIEIVLIKDLLIDMNNKNIFTINSQPVVNCKPSDDHFVGWGPINGFVFQRFYIEFFIDRTKLNKLIEYYLKDSNSITYQAINMKGELKSNLNGAFVIGLTWGVFPDKEIIQPTIYDSEVFLIWKDEAFNSWNNWINIYNDDEDAYDQISVGVLKKVQTEYFLMTIIDNDFINPTAPIILSDFIKSI